MNAINATGSTKKTTKKQTNVQTQKSTNLADSVSNSINKTQKQANSKTNKETTSKNTSANKNSSNGAKNGYTGAYQKTMKSNNIADNVSKSINDTQGSYVKDKKKDTTKIDTQKDTKKETKKKDTYQKTYTWDDSNANLPNHVNNEVDNPNLPSQIKETKLTNDEYTQKWNQMQENSKKTVNDFSSGDEYERFLAENNINSATGNALKYFQDKAKANGTTAREEMQSSRTKWKNTISTEEVRKDAENGKYNENELSSVNSFKVYFNPDGSVYQGNELATYENAIASLDQQEQSLEAMRKYSQSQESALDNPNISTDLTTNENYINEDEYKAQKKEIETARKQANKYYLDNNLGLLTSKSGFEYYDWAKENNLDTSDFEAVAESVDDSYVERLGNAYQASVIDTVNTFVQLPSEIRTLIDKDYDFTDEDTYTSRLSKRSNDLKTYAFSGTDGFENWSLQAFSSIMPQINATLLSVATAGGSTLATTAIMGLQTAGQVTKQRYEEGNSIETALLNGVMHGAISFAVEKIGAERFTSAITGDAESYLMGTALLSNVKLKNALQYINAIGVAEAGEEVMESLANEIADNMLNMFSSDIFGENADLVEVEETSPSELLNQMAMAYFGAGLMGVKAIGQVNINTKLKYNTALNLKEKFEEDRTNAIRLGNDTWRTIAEYAIDAINKDTQNYENKASSIAFGVQLSSDVADKLGDFNTWTKMLAQSTQSDFQDQVKLAEQAYNNYSEFKNLYTQALAERGVAFKDNKIEQYVNLNDDAKTKVQEIVKTINDATPNYSVQFDTDMDANASIEFVNGKPLITLNPNSELAMETNYAHELVHSVENNELYQELSKVAFNSETELQEAMNSLSKNAYEGASEETLKKEAVAKKISEQLLNEDFLDNLAKYNTDVGYKLYYNLRNALSKIKGDNVMQQVESTLIKALNNNGHFLTDNGIEYSISKDGDENVITINRNIFDEANATTRREKLEVLKNFVNQLVGEGKTYKYNLEEKSLNDVGFNAISKRELSNPRKSKTNIEIKGFALSHLEDILENAVFAHENNKKANGFNTKRPSQIGKNGFDRATVTLYDTQAQTKYIVDVVVNNQGNGNYIYDINENKKGDTNQTNSLIQGSPTNNNISNNENNVKQSVGDTLETIAHKEAQNKIIQETNPRDTNLGNHTWIDSVEDIQTFQEAINDLKEDSKKYGYESLELSPDFKEVDINKALETGKITVYSSYDIKNGTWVTPSKMEAEAYGGGKVYSKEVSLGEVAWLNGANGFEGMYANVNSNNTQYSKGNLLNNQKTNKVEKTYNKSIKTGVDNLYKSFKDRLGLSRNISGVKELINTAKTEIEQNGSISEDTYNELYKQVYDGSLVKNSEIYGEQYNPSEIRKYLKANPFNLNEIKRDFSNSGGDISNLVQSHRGSMTFSYDAKNNWDTTMQELEAKYPDLLDYDNIVSAYELVEALDEALDSLDIMKKGYTFDFTNFENEQDFKNQFDSWINAFTYGVNSLHNDLMSVTFDNMGEENIENLLNNKKWLREQLKAQEEYENNARDLEMLTETNGEQGLYEMQEALKNQRRSKILENLNTDSEVDTDTNEKIADLFYDYGMNNAREVDILKYTEKGITMKGARTLANSNWLTDEQASDLQKRANKGEFSYIKDTNQAQYDRAVQYVKKHGWQNTIERALEKPENWKLGEAQETMITGAMALNYLAENGEANSEIAQQLEANWVSATNMYGSGLQSVQVIKRITPQGQVVTIRDEVARMNEGLKERYGNKAKNLVLNEDLLEQFLQAGINGDTKLQEQIGSQIQQDIADQLPTSWAERFSAWRHLAMLSNPKTSFKNFLGNGVWGTVTDFKRIVQTGIETMMGIEEGQRGAGIYNPFNADEKALFQALKTEYKISHSDFQGKYTNGDIGNIVASDAWGQAVESKRATFGNSWLGRFLNKWEKLNGKMMSDTPAMSSAYAKNYIGYLKANNLNLNTMTNEQKISADNYAFEQAKIQTFNATNDVANTIAKLSQKSAGWQMVVDSFIPFKRTPMNVVKEGVRYSPIGLINTITRGAYQLNSGTITATQFADNLASGLTGTGIVLLGALLGQLGLFRTTDDDKDKKQYFDEDNGEQDYAIVINGNTYTIDWLDPLIMPLAMGAELAEVFNGGEGGIDALVDIAGSIADPIFETSMLSGFEKVLNSNNGKKWYENLVENIVSTYVQQYIPSVSGAVARTIDGTRRTTYPNNGFFDKLGKQVANKIPFANQIAEAITGEPISQPYINKQGEVEKNEDLGMGILGRAILQLASPGYYSSNGVDEYDEELYRLYNETGELVVFPSDTSADVTYANEKYKLTGEEYTQWNQTRLSLEKQYVDEFIDSDNYSSFDDSQKVKIIGKIRAYAGDVAKDEFLTSKGIEYDDSSYQSAKEAMNNDLDLYQFYETTEYYNGLTSDDKKNEYISYLEGLDTSGAGKNYMYDKYYGESKLSNAVNEMDISDDEKFAIKKTSAIENLKDEDGNTIKNSKALAVADALADEGLLETVFDYIEKNGLSASDFGLNKTVLNYSYSQLKNAYESMYDEKFGIGEALNLGSGTSSKKSSSKSSSKSSTISVSTSGDKTMPSISSKDYSNTNFNTAYASVMNNTSERQTKKNFGQKTGDSGDSNATTYCNNCGNVVTPVNGKCPVCGTSL